MAFGAIFSDGRTAARHDVTIALTPHGLAISGASIAPASWPLGDIRVLPSDRPTPLRLTRRSDNDVRLIVDDPDFRTALFDQCPELDPRYGRGRRTVALVGGSLAGVAVLAAALWFGLPLLARPVAALVPQSVEARVGSRVLDLVVGTQATCAAPAGQDALDRLVTRVLAGAEQDVDLVVRVVDSPAVNAIAAPGGTVIIFSSLLDKAESPDEVAGVVAHEAGHVVHRHGMQALVRHFALSMVITVFTGSDWGFVSNAAQLLVEFAYSREAESEADATGVAMLERAGLRANGLEAFFARLQKEEGGDEESLMRYLATHPPLRERRAAIARGAAGRPALSNADWDALRKICKQ